MFFRSALRRTATLSRSARSYATKIPAEPVTEGATVAAQATPKVPLNVSSCPANTVLTGLNYLKGQPPVIALPDEEYPPWLWDIQKPKVLPDDGPGGLFEKAQLKKDRQQRIKDANFMKTQ
ncbi:hypothetical protein CONPUDRAFT_147055 [Coniophora puteana RWD-64-598 SS2]|uniref:Large ribosomal subunit protein mL54 n=1 Tax=Coniophora puteana (strain RWD-64-598) TaxID=741705 RepID=A0A5M3MA25_CONPW|nr:uncharacterized protein CONPUDRAFT_147055 [Coniophora puteana RWD-64-598 SS2]EIW76049.1 hypothetical protein CONPUDRAFT_147055 [Coniophora puteana RWD-64-598 SS2]